MTNEGVVVFENTVEAEDVGHEGFTIEYTADIKFCDGKIHDYDITDITVTDEYGDEIPTLPLHRFLVVDDINASDEEIWEKYEEMKDDKEDEWVDMEIDRYRGAW